MRSTQTPKQIKLTKNAKPSTGPTKTKLTSKKAKPSTGPRKVKLDPDGNMHMAAVEALLVNLDQATLVALTQALERFKRDVPAETHKAVQAGVAHIRRSVDKEKQKRIGRA